MTAEEIRTALGQLAQEFKTDPATPVAPETRKVIDELQSQVQLAIAKAERLLHPVRDLTPAEKQAVMFKVPSAPYIGDPSGMSAKAAEEMIRDFKGKQTVRKIAKSEVNEAFPVFPTPLDAERERNAKDLAFSSIIKK